MMMNPPHVLVIGGGFAGIAAAASLRARGVRVTILDDRTMLGGRARSDVLDGMTIDTGAQFIASSFARTVRLLMGAPPSPAHVATPPRAPGVQAGVPPGLHVTPGRDLVLRDDAAYAIRYGSLRSLLAFRGLSAAEKVKLGAHLLPALARHRAELDAGATRMPPVLDREHARPFIASHISDRAADLLVEPPLNSFYATRGQEASLAFFLMLGRYGSESELLAPATGWTSVLTSALSGAVHVAQARVHALDRSGGDTIALAEDGREWRGDAAVIATGPRTARSLLTPLLQAGDPLLDWLGSLALRPTWTLALAVDAPLTRRDVFGVIQDVRRAQMVSACAIYGAKLGAAAPTDRDVVLAWPTPTAALALHGDSSTRITAAMMPEIEQLFPEIRGHVTRARVYRFGEGSPIARPGFAADRARGRAFAEQLTLPVALAGDYLTTPLIEGAVISGERAAATVAGIIGLA